MFIIIVEFMKNCKKCGNNFTPKKGLKDYCSISCRNSRTWNETDKLKKSLSAKKSEKVKKVNNFRPQDFWLKIGEKRKKVHKDRIINSDYSSLSFESLRFRILYEQNEKCNRCGLDKWLNEPLTLELDHIDGNHFNNERTNLEMLCPNCHSLTKTWRGRNKKYNTKYKVSDEDLLNSLLLSDWNFRQALLLVDLAPKGGNYNRCHKLKREYDNLNNLTL